LNFGFFWLNLVDYGVLLDGVAIQVCKIPYCVFVWRDNLSHPAKTQNLLHQHRSTETGRKRRFPELEVISVHVMKFIQVASCSMSKVLSIVQYGRQGYTKRGSAV
jgi:hypothetical protein